MAVTKYRFEDSELAKLLRAKFDDPNFTKTQREVADEVKFKTANMISMLKRGELQVPLERTVALAKAIGEDPKHIFRLALDQVLGTNAVKTCLGNYVSDNEFELVRAWREANRQVDQPVNTRVKKALMEAANPSS